MSQSIDSFISETPTLDRKVDDFTSGTIARPRLGHCPRFSHNLTLGVNVANITGTLPAFSQRFPTKVHDLSGWEGFFRGASGPFELTGRCAGTC